MSFFLVPCIGAECLANASMRFCASYKRHGCTCVTASVFVMLVGPIQPVQGVAGLLGGCIECASVTTSFYVVLQGPIQIVQWVTGPLGS